MKKILTFLLISLFILSSCRTVENRYDAVPGGLKHESKENQAVPAAIHQDETPPEERILQDSRKILSKMTLDEKIGQLFILAMRHTAYGKPALEMDEYLQEFLDKYKPGGIILFSLNFKTPQQTRELIAGLNEYTGTPLFITTDEEGGKVSRLGKQKNMNVISLPPAEELGRRGDPELVRKASAVLATDLRDLGFNMNMAPVADVTRHVSPDVIGNRSFSSDPETAARMVAASVRGYQENRISSVLKHFPGHGYVNGDTHNGMVKARADREEFETVDFLPFYSGIEAGVDFIMTAHIQAPALTGNDMPASMSYRIQTELLRNTLGFKGLIITDAMDMGAVTRYWTPGEAALNAFLAGSDIILMPANIPEAQKSLKEAFLNGIISEERLNSSLIRIISTKIERGLYREEPSDFMKITEEMKNDLHKDIINTLNLTAK